MNNVQTGKSTKRVLVVLAVIAVVGAIAYGGLVYRTKLSVEAAGRSLLNAAHDASLQTTDLPEGSVVVLGADTVAILTGVTLLSKAPGMDTLRYFIAEAKTASAATIAALSGFEAIEDSTAERLTPNRIRLVPVGQAVGVVRGSVVLRVSGDPAQLFSFILR